MAGRGRRRVGGRACVFCWAGRGLVGLWPVVLALGMGMALLFFCGYVCGWVVVESGLKRMLGGDFRRSSSEI